MRPPTGHGSLWLFMLALGGLMILGASNEAGAGGESEPNDNAASADQTTISGYANGTVWGGNPDVWKVDLPGPGLFSTEIERSQRGAYLRFADSGLMGVPTGIEEVTANRDLYSAVISSGGVIYVSVGCDICFGIDYRLTFSFTADLSSISGAGEHESNNAVSFANQVSLNATAEGLVAEKFADVDWWAVQTFSPGWLRLDVDNRENVSVALFAGNVQLSDEMGYGTRFSLYRTPSAERFNLSVVSNGGTNPYSVRFTFGIESAVFWQGTDEIEPNGNASIAMTLAMGVSFKGVGDSSHDASDMFRYHGKRGELVGFNVTFEDDAFGESNVKTVGGVAEWIPVPTVRGSLLTVAYLFATDSYFVFDVRVGTSNGSYRVAVRGQMLPLFSDGIVTLEELNAIPALGLTIHPKNVPNFDPTPHYWEDPVGYNLGNGDGFLFGETLCFRLTVAGDLPEVWVTAGTSFKPTKPELQVLIASRTAATRIPSGDRGCFRAMSHTENGALRVPWDLYAIDGFAVGDAARVIKRINETNLDGAEGQLALWAVTSGTSEERAKQWSASPSTIVSAKTILDGASVKTKLNAPPPNYEILMGAILVGAIVLGAVAVRRRKSNSETFSPPSLASVNSGAAPLVSPPPVPQWPAAPLSAMAPCPQCQQPVGVGNPQCNRCGLPLVWF